MTKRGYKRWLLLILAGVLVLLFAVGFIVGPLGTKLIGDVGLPGWLSVPRPDPKLPAEEVFHLFGFPITNSIIATWVTMVVLVGVSYIATRKSRLVPSGLQNGMEFAITGLLGFCQSVAGEKNGRRFFPVIATIFLFVLANSWLSLLPGFGSILVTGVEGEPVHHALLGA